MKKVLYIVFISLLLPIAKKINAGPMVGYSSKMEVALWIQTTSECDVKFIYWDKTKPDIILETETFKTDKQSGFTATLIADKVISGSEYFYQPIVDGNKIEFEYSLEFKTQKHWEYRTNPPDFSFAFGVVLILMKKIKTDQEKVMGEIILYILQYSKKTRFDDMAW